MKFGGRGGKRTVFNMVQSLAYLFYFTFSSRLKRAKERDSPLRTSKQMHANEGVEGGVRGERREGRAGG